MSLHYWKECGKQAKRQYQRYEHEHDYYPSTKSTLGQLIIGDMALSKKQYERAYESYWEVYRRVYLGPQGAQQIHEVLPEKYKAFALKRLERLVKRIQDDKTYSLHKHKHRDYQLREVEDLAKELIEKYKRR